MALLAAGLHAQGLIQVVPLVNNAPGFSQPNGVAVDFANNYYIADGGGGSVIYMLDANGNAPLPSPVPFAGQPGLFGSDDGVGDAASFNEPWGIVYVPRLGGLVVSDQANQLLRFVDVLHTNRAVSTLAGQLDPVNGGGFADGPGASAQFSFPAGLTVDSAGNIYVADMGNRAIRKMDISNVVSTVISNLSQPTAVALESDTALWVADTTKNQVIRYSFQNGSWTITDTVGTVQGGSNDSVNEGKAGFKQPRGLLWLGGASGLAVADTGNNSVRLISGNTGSYVVTTLTSGNLNTPLGMTYDVDGKIIVADSKSAASLKALVRSAQSAPIMTPSSGAYNNSISVLFSNTFPCIQVFRYTTDGSAPMLNSPIGSGLALDGYATTVHMRSFSPDYLTSPLVSNTYSFFVDAPVMAPAALLTSSNDVTILVTNATTNCALYYTLDGSEPAVKNGTQITNGVFTLATTNAGLRIKGFKNGYTNSVTVSGAFNFVVADPVMQFTAANTYSNDVPVTLDCSTTNAFIRWTVDGSAPTRSNGSTNWQLSISKNCVLQARAFRDCYVDSAIVSNTFNMVADAPVLTPPGVTNFAPVPLTATSATAGAQLTWIIDDGQGNRTTSTTANPGTQTMRINGTLTVQATRVGYDSSPVVSVPIALTADAPILNPTGLSDNKPVSITLTSRTPGAMIYWTADNSEPAGIGPNFVASGGTVLLATNGVFKAKAFAPGFAASQTASDTYNLTVAPILATTSSLASPAIDSNTITLATATANATIKATLSGVAAPFTSAPGAPLIITITNNQTLSATASYLGLAPAQTSVSYQIQVDKPLMSISGVTNISGYFPSGAIVKLHCDRPDATIYYTVNGQSPTVNDLLYPASGIDLNSVEFPKSDLRILKAAAFASNTVPSDVTSGQSVATNSVSVPTQLIGGQGATIIVPVVINMQSNQTVRSLQFNLEVSPLGGGATPNTDTPLEALALSGNDFVQVAGNSAGGYNASFNVFTYTNGLTNGISFYSIATNLSITDFGVLANVKIKIPGIAPANSQYQVNLANITGTSDAQQHVVNLSASPGVITVSNYVYLAGDCSPGRWYNAGDFGNDTLDNADVNAAFLASLGIGTPYPGSDVFNAMDVYPESGGNASGAGGIIGDGLISFLDWQHVRLRSLGRETNSWKRWWQDGTLHHLRISGPGLARSLRQSVSSAAGPATLDTWLRPALIWGGIVTNAIPGNSYSMPIYARVLPGFAVNGMQLRAVMTGQGAAPAPGWVQFASAPAMGAPSTLMQNASNDVVVAWSLGRAVGPMVNSNLIGYVNFTVPTNALAGQWYSLELKYPQGAVDLDTELQMESAAGQVWVLSSPPKPVVHIVSDQWKTNYFGTVNNPNADPDADPDHDGVPNWMEYLAGTNPTNAASHLSFSSAVKTGAAPGVALSWPAMTGRVYVLESSPVLTGGVWTAVSTNIIGDGTMNSFTTGSADQSRFYRIRLVGQ